MHDTMFYKTVFICVFAMNYLVFIRENNCIEFYYYSATIKFIAFLHGNFLTKHADFRKLIFLNIIYYQLIEKIFFIIKYLKSVFYLIRKQSFNKFKYCMNCRRKIHKMYFFVSHWNGFLKNRKK